MYRILAIEDDPIIQEVFKKSLEREGYECFLAPRISLGIAAAAKEKPDLILLDVNLPDGNGIDACRQLKADPIVRHIPVVIVTGQTDSVENRVDGIEAGADDYLIKPFNTKELLTRVKGILHHGIRPSKS